MGRRRQWLSLRFEGGWMNLARSDQEVDWS